MELALTERIPLHHYKHACATRGICTINVYQDYIGESLVYDIEVTGLKHGSVNRYDTIVETEHYSDLPFVTNRFLELVNQRALTI